MKNENLKSLLKHYNLSKKEYKQIQTDLQKIDISTLEISIYAALWSEHCAYKHSKSLLQNLPTKANYVLQGPGENAGVIDIGEGWALALKIESHNHPSAINPFHGASTGVGGMLRDIIAMGARPIAILNGLFVGNINQTKPLYEDNSLLPEIVKGIGFYGNCIGVPTIGGDIALNSSYQEQPIVNIMGIGLLRKDKIIRSKISNIEHIILYVGAKTGSDGVGGSLFSSKNLNSNKKKEKEKAFKNIQIGDPFLGNSLMEFCLDLHEKNWILAMQDLGAAGIIGALSELCYHSNLGAQIFLDAIPKRRKNLSNLDILLSESQERMLIVVEKEKVKKIKHLASHLNLECEEIVKILKTPYIEIIQNKQLLTKIPLQSLCNPMLIKKNISNFKKKSAINIETKKKIFQKNSKYLKQLRIKDWQNLLKQFISKNFFLISKQKIYRQFDSSIGSNTIIYPGESGASMLRIKDSSIKIASSLDLSIEYMKVNSKKAIMILISKSLRNLIVVGAKPLAIVNGLNLGNPKKQKIYRQFVKIIQGMTQTCNFFKIPIVSGNVSFYNENNQKSIPPSPIIGSVGLVNPHVKPINMKFKEADHLIFLIGNHYNEIGSSQFLAFKKKLSIINHNPFFKLDVEKKLQEFILSLIEENLLASVNDISEGGLLISLLRSIWESDLGIDIQFPDSLQSYLSEIAFLFSESQSRFLISIKKESEKQLIQKLKLWDIPYHFLGKVIEKKYLRIAKLFNLKLADIYETSLFSS